MAPAQRSFSQRYTLIEILFFLAHGAVGVSILFYAAGKCESRRRGCIAPIKTARIAAQDLQWIAEGWRMENDNQCPSPQRLKDENQLSAGTSLYDPWGSPWRIDCEGDNAIVVSAGPDRDAGTADDILYPPAP